MGPAPTPCAWAFASTGPFTTRRLPRQSSPATGPPSSETSTEHDATEKGFCTALVYDLFELASADVKSSNRDNLACGFINTWSKLLEEQQRARPRRTHKTYTNAMFSRMTTTAARLFATLSTASSSSTK